MVYLFAVSFAEINPVDDGVRVGGQGADTAGLSRGG